jgi:N-acetyl-gamma-glutamyl-phosphate reductase
MLEKIKIAIIGASGYTGVELIRILLNHQKAEIVNLVASANAGKEIKDIYPHLSSYNLPKIQKLEEINLKEIDLVFCCLPHATSQKIISDILIDKNLDHLKIIDLSADFRLKNIDDYKKWYGSDHISPELQNEAIYGLSEFSRKDIKKSQPRLIACPGCYPTSALLPLLPLLESKIIKQDNIIIDSKSGISGAGRALKESLLFTEVNEGVKAYNVNIHRHLAEIEQELQFVSNSNDIKISFTPHLVPMNRGIISTIYVDLNDNIKISDAKNTLETYFEDEYFVEIVSGYPSTRDVLATNNCKIALFESRIAGKMVIVSVIDNLTKGSSGQAAQNMNILFGFDEREGLNLLPIFP